MMHDFVMKGMFSGVTIMAQLLDQRSAIAGGAVNPRTAIINIGVVFTSSGEISR
jgi:hypothetical protein